MTGKAAAVIVAAVAAGTAASGAAAKTPAVVASILPVQALAAGVMQGVGEPTLLIKGGGSPHAYTLRPSEAAALQRADVVLWIGAGLETFLEKPLAALARRARVVALAETDGLVRWPYRGGNAWNSEAGGGGDHDQVHGREHDHGDTDLHLWLDPANAGVMAARIEAVLRETDPGNAERYRTNAAAVTERLAALDAALERDLAPVRGRAYVVFHDAYQYFDRRYGLAAAGAITIGPERQPSAQRLAEVRRRIVATGAICVFAEPQFEPALVRTAVEGTEAKVGVLDPLGADLAAGADAYFTLMTRLAAALTGCLNRPN
jgi:zinc transport system substrate-binding protein